MNATAHILDKTLPDDPFVCSLTGELFAYISLSANTEAGARYALTTGIQYM